MYAGDRPGGMWLSPTSRLGIGGSLYHFEWPSAFTSFAIIVNSMGAVDRPNGSALNW